MKKNIHMYLHTCVTLIPISRSVMPCWLAPVNKCRKRRTGVKGALQLLMNRYGQIRFAQVPKRVSTKSFVVLIIGNSKSNHLGLGLTR